MSKRTKTLFYFFIFSPLLFAVQAQDSLSQEQILEWVDKSPDTAKGQDSLKEPEETEAGTFLQKELGIRFTGFLEAAMGLRNSSIRDKQSGDTFLKRMNHLAAFGIDIEGNLDIKATALKNLNVLMILGIARGDERIALESLRGSEQQAGYLALEAALLEYTPYSFLGLEGGILEVPFSRYNRNFDETVSPWLVRGDFYTYLVPTPWYDAGVMIKGKMTLKKIIETAYYACIVNGLGDDVSGGRGLQNAMQGIDRDNNRGKALTGRIDLELFNHGGIAVSGYSGDVDIFDHHTLNMGMAEIFFSIPQVSLEAGLLECRLDSMVNTQNDTLPTAISGKYVELHANYYIKRIKSTVVAALGFETINLDETERMRDEIGFPSDRWIYSFALGLRPHERVFIKTQMRFPKNKEDDLNPRYIDDDIFLFGVTVGW